MDPLEYERLQVHPHVIRPISNAYNLGAHAQTHLDKSAEIGPTRHCRHLAVVQLSFVCDGKGTLSLSTTVALQLLR